MSGSQALTSPPSDLMSETSTLLDLDDGTSPTLAKDMLQSLDTLEEKLGSKGLAIEPISPDEIAELRAKITSLTEEVNRQEADKLAADAKVTRLEWELSEAKAGNRRQDTTFNSAGEASLRKESKPGPVITSLGRPGNRSEPLSVIGSGSAVKALGTPRLNMIRTSDFKYDGKPRPDSNQANRPERHASDDEWVDIPEKKEDRRVRFDNSLIPTR